MRRAGVRRLAGTSTSLKVAAQTRDVFLIFLFHLHMGLLELEDLATDELHLLNLVCELMFILVCTSTLSLELGADLLEQLDKTVVWWSRSAGYAAMRVVHGDVEIGGVGW